MTANNVINTAADFIQRSKFNHLMSGSAQEVVDALYPLNFLDSNKDIDLLLRDIATAMPTNNVEAAAVCDAVDNVNLKLLCLKAALLAVTGENGWIHYRICVILFSLREFGVRRLDFPLATHCLLILNRIQHSPEAAHFIARMSSALLKDVSLFDSAQFALQAINVGNRDAIENLKHLHKIGRDPKTPLSDLALVEKYRSHNNAGAFERIISDVDFLREGSDTYFAPPDNGVDHFIFRYRASGVRKRRPDISVHVIEGGSISIRTGGISGSEFYFFTEDGKLIENLSYGLRPFRSQNAVRKTGSLALISDRLTMKSNICHFLLDHLTRVKIYESSYGKIDNFIFLQDDQYIRDACVLLGVDDRSIMINEQEIEISADNIVISSNLAQDWSHPAHYCDPSLLEMFSDWPEKVRMMRSKTAVGAARRRIFISRDDATSRKILNQQEVDAVLERFDFEKLTLSQYDIFDQIELFSEASVVIGVHGAGLTNILFGDRDMKVIEILPPLVATDAYWLLARARGQSYSALIGIDPEFGVPNYDNWSHKVSLNDRNLTVNIQELESVIVEALQA